MKNFHIEIIGQNENQHSSNVLYHFKRNSQSYIISQRDDEAIILIDEQGNQQELCQGRFLYAFYQIENDQLVICTSSGSIFIYHKIFEKDFEGHEALEFSQGIKACAISPDHDLLVVVDCDGIVSILNRYFDLVNEAMLETSDNGVDALVNVGWGKKETQFHGSEGKAAALQKNPFDQGTSKSLLWEMDSDEKVNISWRQDSEYFVISYVCKKATTSKYERRILQVYDREGTLRSKSEPVDGLEPPLSWKPSGNLIATTQKGKILFFERNGLIKGNFKLQKQDSIIEHIHWSPDSTLLCIVYKDFKAHFYSMDNYQWDLKREITLTGNYFLSFQSNNSFVVNGPHGNLKRYEYRMAYDHFEGLHLKVSGKEIHSTLFSKVNIPPPMYSEKYTAECYYETCSIYDTDLYCFMSSDYLIQLSTGQVIDLAEYSDYQVKQILLLSNSKVVLLMNKDHDDFILSVDSSELIRLSHILRSIQHIGNGQFIGQSEKGDFIQLNLSPMQEGVVLSKMASEKWDLFNNDIVHLMNSNLCCNGKIVASNISDFLMHRSSRKLIASTFDHEIAIYDLEKDFSLLETRKVENGSMLVTCFSYKLILQMPRGNLETIYPRFLLTEQIEAFVREERFRPAFELCRKHRINLDILLPLSNIGKFIVDVEKIDYLNLFISTTTNLDYEQFRNELVAIDKLKYLEPILTTFVKHGKDYEGALNFILQIENSTPALIDKLISYLIFLVNVDELFDSALGIYQFDLVLAIARHSQKDPQQYLELVNYYKSLPADFQKYKINVSLGRIKKALFFLSKCEDKADLCLDFIKQHSLYEEAMNIYQLNDCMMKKVLVMYADSLNDDKKAAFLYLQAQETEKALELFMKLALVDETLALSTAGVRETAIELVHNLKFQKRYAEATELSIEYIKDPELIVSLAVEARRYLKAIEQSRLYKRSDLIETVVEPGYLEYYETLLKEIQEMKDKFVQKKNRWDLLQERKNEKLVDTAIDETIVIDDQASVLSHLTATSAMTRKSSKSKRKEMRHKLRGREGSMYEQEYILLSFKTTIEKYPAFYTEIENLIKVFLFAKRTSMAIHLKKTSNTLFQMLKHDILPVFKVPVYIADLGKEDLIAAPLLVETKSFDHFLCI